nr:hypothetical protein CFP56_24522 [Quercus suber]
MAERPVVELEWEGTAAMAQGEQGFQVGGRGEFEESCVSDTAEQMMVSAATGGGSHTTRASAQSFCLAGRGNA